MPFLSVAYTNFRNIANNTIDLLSKEVYFVGKNGQGKSNILESLYMSAYGVSFRTRNEAEIPLDGQTEYSIRAIFRDSKERTNSIHIIYQDGKKRLKRTPGP
ncbi:AAA family ATPase [Brucepastera parasyntrophica]|uniref:AAA family ATPase n=1 Tax=Brucepastera parasyntrophica TaxID=2880008 RepID=UPI002108C31E|nr:AAA family ATPase [Brucepastera parasyntrophica]ULQ58617.1 AAA family ATPase [Brucepastera parasyntrophica]